MGHERRRLLRVELEAAPLGPHEGRQGRPGLGDALEAPLDEERVVDRRGAVDLERLVELAVRAVGRQLRDELAEGPPAHGPDVVRVLPEVEVEAAPRFGDHHRRLRVWPVDEARAVRPAEDGQPEERRRVPREKVDARHVLAPPRAWRSDCATRPRARAECARRERRDRPRRRGGNRTPDARGPNRPCSAGRPARSARCSP